MALDDAINTILGIRLVSFIQLIAILFTVIYLIFSLVILRQAQLMTRTLRNALSPIIIFLAIVNIGIPIVLLILLIGNVL